MSHSASHRARPEHHPRATAASSGRRGLLLTLVLGLVLGAGAGVLTERWIGSDSRAETSAVDELRELEGKRLRALVAADASVLDGLHAEDFTLVPATGYPMTREAYLSAVEGGALDYRVLEPVSEIDVAVDGDTAVLWYQSRVDVVAVGQGSGAHDAWHLCLYEKRAGSWQVVREQAAAVGSSPPEG